jgi:Asp-tRNA(Asn)/Glu-tRNA(Gln) amidotransferase B subunit
VVLSLGISEARMERGNLRCDANVSLRPRGQEKLGTRTETKNVNSMRSVERAVRYEIQRQAAILAAGGTITQETRHWHEDTGTTSPGVRSRMPTTTATSRSPICCPSRRRRSSSSRCAPRCRSRPPRVGAA